MDTPETAFPSGIASSGPPSENTRRYPARPWVAVGVVVCHADAVLLVQRGRPPRCGAWGLPGGALHLGETIFAAAIREVWEETGLKIAPRAIITAVDSITRDTTQQIEYHYSIIEVAATLAATSSTTPVAADDARAARWVPLAQVADWLAWDETQRVITRAQEVLSSVAPTHTQPSPASPRRE